MASVLAGVRPNNQPVDLAGSLLGGQQARQSVLAGQQQLQQGQMQLDRAPQVAAQQDAAAAQQQQLGQQQIGENDFMMAVQRGRIINRLAKQVRQMPAGQRPQFVQALDPEMLRSVGIDPAQIKDVGLDDNSLDAIIAQTEAALSSVDGGEPQARVQSSENLPGGVTRLTMADGTVRVVGPEGQDLEGQERAQALENARQLGIQTQRETFAAREGGKLGERLEVQPELEDRVVRAREEAKNATGQAKEYFQQLESISGNIANYNQAINALDEGANTGAVARRLPSVKAASVKLENAVNNLGLNVIQNTTFGALSEAELDFALRSAVPDNLQEDELREFLVQKRDAQAKLADYLEGAVQFLSVPGNTLADLRATNPSGSAQQPRQEGGQTPAPSETQRIRFDAQGNIIQ